MSNGGYKGASPARETSPEQYPGVWELTEQFQAQADGNWPFQADDCAPKSVRFDGSSSYLSKTPKQAGNKRTWTFSFWVKRCNVGNAAQVIWMAYNAAIDEANYATISFTGTGQLRVGWAYDTYKTTTAQYRDPSAWMHCCISVDTNHAVASERVQIAINGVKQTEFAGSHDPDLGQQLAWNGAYLHHLGSESSQQYSHNYLSEIQFVDGQQLSCEEFGFYDGQGLWMPKRFTGDYSSGPVLSNNFSGGAFYSNGSWDQAFDGSLSTGPFLYSTATNTLTLPPGITWKNSIRVYALRYDGGFEINGTNILASHTIGTGAGWHDLTPTLGSSGTLSTILIGCVNTNYFKLFAIELDGQILTNPSVGRNSYHLDFSQDEVGVAKDQSGLANNWTAQNVGGPVKGLIAGVTINAPSNVTLQSAAVQNMFNGNKDNYTYAHTNDATNYIQWTPTGGYTTNGHIWIQGGDGNGAGTNTMEVQINGSVVSRTAVVDNETYSQAGYGWGDWHKYPVAGNTLTSLRLTGAYALIRQLSTVDDPTHSVLGISDDNDVPAITDTLPSATDYFVDSPVNGNEASTGAGGERRGNYCTWSPIDSTGTNTLSNGNLDCSGAQRGNRGTIAVTSGKYYYETVITSFGVGGDFGWSKSDEPCPTTDPGANSYGWSVHTSGLKRHNGSTSSYISGGLAVGDVIQFAIDVDAGKVWFGKNNTWGASGDPAAGTNAAFTNVTGPIAPAHGNGGSAIAFTTNFGQRSFSYAPPAGFSPLATSFLPEPTIKRGDEAMAAVVYSGNNANNKIKLDFAPDILWLKSTTTTTYGAIASVVEGANYFNPPSDTGAQKGPGFNDDIKSFDDDGFTLGADTYYNAVNRVPHTYSAFAWDAGDATTTIAAGGLNSSVYDNSQTWSGQVSGSVYSSSYAKTNAFSGTVFNSATLPANNNTLTFTPSPSFTNAQKVKIYYYYPTAHADAWKINGISVGNNIQTTGGRLTYTFDVSGTGFTSLAWSRQQHGTEDTGVYGIEVDGKLLVDNGVTLTNVPTLATTVRANPSTGCSAIKYSGGSDVATVVHGLNKEPHFAFFKKKQGGEEWGVYHRSLGNAASLRFKVNSAGTSLWQSKDPTSLVMPLSYQGAVNESGGDYLGFLWTSIEGFSSFGSFEGNDLDPGPFVHLGFRAKLLFLKNADASQDWIIYDTSRSTSNEAFEFLGVQYTAAQNSTADNNSIDILSNGFIPRAAIGTNDAINGPSNTIVYCAWAEHPFASNCRAR